MPRVIITRYAYAHSNEEALQMAREARMCGFRSEIISDREYDKVTLELGNMQDLTVWAEENNIEYKPSV